MTHRLAAVLFAVVSLVIAPTTWAQPDQPVTISIEESQSLSDALQSFADQTDLQVIFFADITEGKTTSGVEGEYPVDAALDTLLADTGLSYTFIDDTAVSVQAVATDTGGASDSKNSNPAPVLMAQRVASEEQARQKREEDGDEEIARESTGDDDDNVRGQIETIVVVGSRNAGIRRYEDDAQPYVVFEASEIEMSSANNLEDFLRDRLPQNAVQVPFSLNQGTFSQAAGNQSSINLRGLGTDQTLVLINGRRLASRSSGGFNRQQSDINAIPMSTIERIEILPSTASGIYGGGATGGVINIVLKRQYSGTDITVGYDNTFDTDTATRRIDATGGFGFEGGRTNVLWSLSYSDSNELVEADRGFGQRSRNLFFRNDPDQLLTSTRVLSSTLNIASADGGDLVLDDGTALGSPITFVPIGYAGPSSDGGTAFVNNAGQFNLELPRGPLGQRNSLVNNPEITSGSLLIEREFAPWLNLFADVAYYSNEGRTNRSFSSTFGF